MTNGWHVNTDNGRQTYNLGTMGRNGTNACVIIVTDNSDITLTISGCTCTRRFVDTNYFSGWGQGSTRSIFDVAGSFNSTTTINAYMNSWSPQTLVAVI